MNADERWEELRGRIKDMQDAPPSDEYERGHEHGLGDVVRWMAEL